MKLFLSLGSNLGDREQNLRKAIELINEDVGTVVRQSSFIATAPVDFVSDNQFLNAAVLVETHLSPFECLHATQKIERQLGRTRKSVEGKHFDRTIDIDLLLYDDLTINTPELTIPHPRMNEREFVKIPLEQIIKQNI
ncbi:MAG: 2-amino-4-hydroxy-6-hydroxymethyldihydropteridine diphosphokinase [Bacteroidaceae bacterium]|nr:2-amino-4-hydroxy-6-hydroxymethyldihydropteridine diphosphokinase [Bacteroidaceae bacterium]